MIFHAVVDGGEAPDRILACRATVLVSMRKIDEVLFVKLALRAIAGGQRLWNERRHAKLLTGAYFGTAEVTPIRENGQALLARRFLGALTHCC